MLGAVVLGMLGCSHTQQVRSQAADESERDRYAIKTIGDVTSVANTESTTVGGVGIVSGLDGTGGDPPPGGYRTMMEDELRKRKFDHVKEILESKNNSIVLVSAVIPAGAHKGDPVDVQVTLPPGSKTSSLRGGYLKECVLYSYDTAKNLLPNYNKTDVALKGFPLAKAEGSLLVGFGDGDEQARVKQGVIWGGGRCAIDFPFFLVLNDDRRYTLMASAVADRINETFHAAFQGGPQGEMAVAKTKSVVVLRVPDTYRHNLPRYLRVVRLIPLREPDKLKELQADRLGSATGVTPGTRVSYRRRLEADLLEPNHTITAALRLEALGTESIPALKQGLDSEHTLVRFAAAEALAYMDCSSAGEELGRLVEEQPALRAFCLTALASLNEAVSHVELSRLLAAPSAETRYGAFRALRALDDRDPVVKGEWLNESFWLHRVAPNATPLVHLAGSRRVEVVLFGTEPRLVPPFSFLAGEYTVTAAAGDDRCTITYLGTSKQQCALRLADVLKTLADLGAMYPEVVEVVRQADRCQCLSCPVAIDALPQATSVYELAKEGGSRDPQLLVGAEEIRKARSDFGSTPTLFEKDSGQRSLSALERDEEAALHDRKPKKEKKTAERHTPPAVE